MLLLGLFATHAVNEAGADGLLYGGGLGQLGKQAVAVLAAAWAFVISFAPAWAVRATMVFRVDTEVETGGIDEAEHAGTAYEYSPLSTTSRAVQAHAPQEETAG